MRFIGFGVHYRVVDRVLLTGSCRVSSIEDEEARKANRSSRGIVVVLNG